VGMWMGHWNRCYPSWFGWLLVGKLEPSWEGQFFWQHCAGLFHGRWQVDPLDLDIWRPGTSRHCRRERWWSGWCSCCMSRGRDLQHEIVRHGGCPYIDCIIIPMSEYPLVNLAGILFPLIGLIKIPRCGIHEQTYYSDPRDYYFTQCWAGLFNLRWVN
jgi:hypothetical protein